jgi:hypothetical protein
MYNMLHNCSNVVQAQTRRPRNICMNTYELGSPHTEFGTRMRILQAAMLQHNLQMIPVFATAVAVVYNNYLFPDLVLSREVRTPCDVCS